MEGERAMPTTASADFIDHQMAKALSHPERVRIMSEFSGLGRAWMSASIYARRHDLDVSYVATTSAPWRNGA